jgi:Protein of unknown function (DUF2809)
MRIRFPYLLLALLTFGLEVLIATQLRHTGFIRGSLGDFFVVILIYCLAQSLRALDPFKLSCGVFILACLVESAQYFHLADAVGLRRGSVLYILLGNTFSWGDILMYLLGCVAMYAFDRYLIRPRWVRTA